MKLTKYISNGVADISTFLPLLTVTFSVCVTLSELMIFMIPALVNRRKVYVVHCFRFVPDGHTYHPIGVIKAAHHPGVDKTFKQTGYVSVWLGGARVNGHQIAITYLEIMDNPCLRPESFADNNLTASTVHTLVQHYDFEKTTFAGHRVLGWAEKQQSEDNKLF